MATQQQIDQFHHFASEHLRCGGSELSIAELFDLWQAADAPASDLMESVSAVKAALADMENGDTGKPFSEFTAEFRRRYGISTPDRSSVK